MLPAALASEPMLTNPDPSHRRRVAGFERFPSSFDQLRRTVVNELPIRHNALPQVADITDAVPILVQNALQRFLAVADHLPSHSLKTARPYDRAAIGRHRGEWNLLQDRALRDHDQIRIIWPPFESFISIESGAIGIVNRNALDPKSTRDSA
jgi:hypothetical protein